MPDHRFKYMLQNSHFGYVNYKFIRNNDGAIKDILVLDYNVAVLSIFGFSSREIPNTFIRQLFPIISDSDFDKIIEHHNSKDETIDNYEFELYSETAGKWLNIQLFRFETDIFSSIFEDISEKVKYKQSNLDISQKFNRFFENMQDILYQVDMDGRIISLSPSVERYGYKRDELLGTFIKDLYYCYADREQLLSNISNDGQISDYELIFKDSIGGKVYTSATSNYIYSTEGIPIGIEGILRDISERKKAELELNESEARYKALVNNSFEGILILAMDGTIVFSNKAFLKAIGAKDESEMLGKTVFDFLAPESITKAIEDFTQVEQGIDSFISEYRAFTLQGDEIYIESIGKVIEYNGMKHDLISIKDITDRKALLDNIAQSEFRHRELYTLLRLLSDTMPDMMWAKDTNKRYIFANRAVCKNLLNAVDTDEPIGKTDMYFAERQRDSRPDRPDWHTFGEQCMNSDETTLQFLKEMQFDEFGNVKGEFLFLDVHKAPLYDNNGNVIGIVGTARDITNKIKAEKDLKESEKKLKETNATKDRFFSIIAHDLRSPISGFREMCKLLVNDYENLTSSEVLKYVLAMEESSETLYSLIINLLKWSQSQSGEIGFYPKNKDIVKVINSTLATCSSMSLQKQISIICKASSPVFAIFDLNMISSVLLNIISNSIKFTKPNGIIEVGILENSEIDTADQLTIFVKDNGVGISESNLDKLFKIDESISTLGTNRESGTGLGLILCKEFIEKHNGTIWANSTEGLGTIVYFTIPKYYS